MNSTFMLLVEDDEHFNNALSEALELLNFKHETVTDGAIAYEQILQYQPELVLLDLQLTNASGYDVLNAIRHDPRLDATKVIIMTGNQFVDMADLQLADAVLIKPFTLNALCEAIELVITRGFDSLPPNRPLSSGFW